jgi:hypothetical protein
VSDPDSPIDPRDIELLRTMPPDPAARALARARLATILPMGGGARTGGDGPASEGGASWARATRSPAPYIVTITTFLLGGVVGAVLHAQLAKPPPARVVYVDRPVAAPPPPSSPPAESNSSARTPPLAVSISPAPPSMSRGSQLSAERAILEETRTAIVQGNGQAALDRLEGYRRSFPNPLLSEERDALLVEALVKVGRYDEARARARLLRKRMPDSIFLPMVDAAIRAIP